MVSLIVTIVVIIIIAAMFVVRMSGMPGEAHYNRFVQEVTNLEEAIYEYRLNNAVHGSDEKQINAGFKKVILLEAPSEFISFDRDSGVTTGYLINLDLISYSNAEHGHDYGEDEGTFTFNEDDVYVYDATGSVYYVKGITYKKTKIYSLASAALLNGESDIDGPIITNVYVTSGELADGTPTWSKAKVYISAFPRNGGVLTVTVRNNVAEKVDGTDGTYATQVLRNGMYSIIVTEENGGRTVTKLDVTDIIESVEPPVNLSMIINDGDLTTQSNKVDIKVRADGATKMLITKNDAIKPAAQDSRWQTYEENFEYDLGSTEGQITLYAWFKDDLSNVTTTIVKSSILYDKTPPDQTAPEFIQHGSNIVVIHKQKDNLASIEILEKNMEYGYAEYDGVNDGEYTWSSSNIMILPKNNYRIRTRTKDQAGNASTSDPVEVEVSYDFIIQFMLEEGGAVYKEIPAEANQTISLPLDRPEKPGYNFNGWSETPNSISGIPEGGAYTTPSYDGIMIKKLYAAWEPRNDIPYTVKHYVESLENPGEYEERVEARENKTGTTGKDVVATYLEEDFEGFIKYEEHPSTIASALIQIDGSTELSLYYKRKRSTLTVIAENGAAEGTTMDVPYEKEIWINTQPNEGYKFLQWVIDGEPDDSKYYESFINANGRNRADAIFKMAGKDITLIAKNVTIDYLITYDLDGGTVSGENPSTYTRETPAFTLINPTKKGYNFAGWEGTDLSGKTMNVTIDSSLITTMIDRQYKATYEPAPELLTLNATPKTPTNDVVRVTINCMDPELTIRYKVGELGAWELYEDAAINVKENTTVYAEAMKDGILVDSDAIVIANIDKVAPTITNITVAENWYPGDTLEIKIEAVDGVMMGTYATTSYIAEPSEEYFKDSNEIAIATEGLNYAWARDVAGNMISKAFYAWDISQNEDRTVYAIILDNNKLLITGNGKTKNFLKATEVPYMQFKDSIEKVEIEEGITTIQDYALSDLTNIKNIKISSTVESFTDKSLMKSNVFENIELSQNNKNLVYQKYTLYNNTKTTIYTHSSIDNVQTYNIPNSVNKILDYAFYNNDKILKIVTEGNASVGSSAFEACDNLFEIQGEIGGTILESRAFAECINLEVLKISDTLEKIESEVFYNTISLQDITIPKTVSFVASEDTSINEVFKNIGINSQEAIGTVRYYQSSKAMNSYARTYSSEANFVVIDDIAPSLLALKVENTSGEYAQGTIITFVAEYDEILNDSHDDGIPTLTIKIGDGEDITVNDAQIQGDKIIYKYTIAEDDDGELIFVSYRGIVYDLIDNIAEIEATELENDDIVVNTVVKLEEGIKVAYYSSLVEAIAACASRPENASKLTLYKDIIEPIMQVTSDKYIHLNMNGKTVTGLWRISGKISIENGKIQSAGNLVAVSGGGRLDLNEILLDATLGNGLAIRILSGAKVYAKDTTIKSNAVAIRNAGELIVENSYFTANRSVLIANQDSISNIKGSSFISSEENPSYRTILINKDATVFLDNSKIEAVKKTAVDNIGALEITGTTIVSGDGAIINSGDVIIRDGTIVSTGDNETITNHGTIDFINGTIKGRGALENNCAFEMAGGIIEATSYGVINNENATLDMKNGTISAEVLGIANYGEFLMSGMTSKIFLCETGVENYQGGSVKITGGTIERAGDNGDAIYNCSSLNISNAEIILAGGCGIANCDSGTVIANKVKITGTETPEISSVIGIDQMADGEIILTDITIDFTVEEGFAWGIVSGGRDGIVRLITGDIKVEVEEDRINDSAGIYNIKGTVIVGDKETGIEKDVPTIESSIYGYRGIAEFAYYDGKFIGAEGKSIVGKVSDRPESAVIRREINDGIETAYLEIDLVKPTATLTVDTEDCTSWTNKEITLTGTGHDDSGAIVAYAFTKTPEEPAENEWIEIKEVTSDITETLKVSEYATYYFQVMDEAGNIAVSNAQTAFYDNTAPIIDSIIQIPQSDTWAKGPATITVNASDNISKIDGIEFAETKREVLEEGSYITVSPSNTISKSFISDNAIWHIYVKDQAGNVAYGTCEVANIDLSAPLLTITLEHQTEEETIIRIEAVDGESGISGLYVNGVLQTALEEKTNDRIVKLYKIENSGIYTIKAIDNVLNENIETLNVYAISYNGNGGVGPIPSQMKVHGYEIPITSNTFTREGYKFESWNTNPEGLETTYNPGDAYTEDRDLVLYAIWEDDEAPEVIDVSLSDEWILGNTAKLNIVAKDNVEATKYQITTTNEEPAEWSTSPNIEVTEFGELYAWVADEAGNTSSMKFVLYDLSKTGTQNQSFGFLKTMDNGKYLLSIEGKGEVKSMSLETLPWEEYRSKIEKVDVKYGVTTLGSYSLSNLTNVKQIVLPSTVESIQQTTFKHTNSYDEIVIDGSNFVYVEGILYNAAKSIIYTTSAKRIPSKIVIPGTVNNISQYAFENSTVKEVTFLKSNIMIQEGVFYNATKLERIITEDSFGTTRIGASGFEGCINLKEIELSQNMRVISDRAFYDCRSLTNIVMGKKIMRIDGDEVFTNIGADAESNNVYYYQSNYEMSEYAASNSNQATFIPIDDIPPEITSVVINDNAEYTSNSNVKLNIAATDNTEVTHVYISEDDKYVPTGLEQGWITFDAEVQYTFTTGNGSKILYVYVKDDAGNVSEKYKTDSILLADYNFEMTGKTEVVQYVDLTGKDYFVYRDEGFVVYGDSTVVNITGEVNHKEINEYELKYEVTYEDTYEDVVIGTYTRKIDVIANDWGSEEYECEEFKVVVHTNNKYAKIVSFKNSNNFSTLNIPSEVTVNGKELKVIDVGNGTNPIYEANTTIKKVVLPNTIINVSDRAFDNFLGLSSIDYNNSLMSIGSYAFANSNQSYDEVIIKNNVRVVNDYAFYNTKIKKITIEDGAYKIGKSAFEASDSGSAGMRLSIPSTIKEIGQAAFYGVDISQIIVDTTNANFIQIDNKFLLSANRTMLYKYATGGSDTLVEIPTRVATIGEGAFAEMDSLTEVVFGSSVSEIKNRAFKGTNLSKIIIKDEIRTVGSEAFANIETLQKVIFEGTPEISGDIFVNSNNLRNIIAIDNATPIEVTSALTINEEVVLYVFSNVEMYRNQEEWQKLGDERIRAMAALEGSSEITLEHGQTYNEEGIILFETLLLAGSGKVEGFDEFEVQKETDLDTNALGEYTINYNVYCGEELVGTLQRTIHVQDTKAPQIIKTTIADSWESGSLKIEVTAEDDYYLPESLKYAVSTEIIDNDTDVEWFDANIVTLPAEKSYIYVKDDSNNFSYIEVYGYDISENEDEKVFAYFNGQGKLEIAGAAETINYENPGTQKWISENLEITEIEIKEGVIHVGEFVLSGMEAVTTITIPNTLTNISENTFAKTNNFTNLNVGAENTALIAQNNYTLTSSDGTIIYLHSRQDENTRFVMDDAVNKVAPYAFYRNDNLTTVKLSANADIGEYAFAACTNLTGFEDIEVGGTSIGTGAFQNMYALVKMTIAKTVTTLGTEIFKGVNRDGIVYYYASCVAMKEYARVNSEEANFMLIDDVKPNDTAPELKTSSSTILVTAKQEDEDTYITKVFYNIRKEGEEYDEAKWQEKSYFLKLEADTTYYVKTRAVDVNSNEAESNEASTTTNRVPAALSIYAMPATPTSGEVEVVIEWPQSTIDILYSDNWDKLEEYEVVKVYKEVGIQKSTDSSISWESEYGEYVTEASTVVRVTENNTTVYARLFDEKNYTKPGEIKSLVVANIDREKPQGTVFINHDAEETTDTKVTLTLRATDNTDDKINLGYGVKWYYASEEASPSLASVQWNEYKYEQTEYEFTLDSVVEASSVAEVYVWYKDAAGNISDKISDDIVLVGGVAKLDEEGMATRYYMSLQAAIDNANSNSLTTPSKITIMKNIQQEGTITVPKGKNIVIETDGFVITQTAGDTITAIENHGLLAIRNTETASESNITVTTNSGDVTGIHNTGMLDIDDVSIIVTTPTGNAVAIYNQNIDEEDIND